MKFLFLAILISGAFNSMPFAQVGAPPQVQLPVFDVAAGGQRVNGDETEWYLSLSYSGMDSTFYGKRARYFKVSVVGKVEFEKEDDEVEVEIEDILVRIAPVTLDEAMNIGSVRMLHSLSLAPGLYKKEGALGLDALVTVTAFQLESRAETNITDRFSMAVRASVAAFGAGLYRGQEGADLESLKVYGSGGSELEFRYRWAKGQGINLEFEAQGTAADRLALAQYSAKLAWIMGDGWRTTFTLGRELLWSNTPTLNNGGRTDYRFVRIGFGKAF